MASVAGPTTWASALFGSSCALGSKQEQELPWEPSEREVLLIAFERCRSDLANAARLAEDAAGPLLQLLQARFQDDEDVKRLTSELSSCSQNFRLAQSLLDGFEHRILSEDLLEDIPQMTSSVSEGKNTSPVSLSSLSTIKVSANDDDIQEEVPATPQLLSQRTEVATAHTSRPASISTFQDAPSPTLLESRSSAPFGVSGCCEHQGLPRLPTAAEAVGTSVRFDLAASYLSPETSDKMTLRASNSTASGGSLWKEAAPFFREGERVEVWSSSASQWLEGLVAKVYLNSAVEGKWRVPAGCTKVASAMGTKYVRVEDASSLLRPLPPRQSYQKGQQVEIWSNTKGQWLEGIVEEVYTRATEVDGFMVPPSCVRVISEAGLKYVPSEKIPSTLRHGNTFIL